MCVCVGGGGVINGIWNSWKGLHDVSQKDGDGMASCYGKKTEPICNLPKKQTFTGVL